MGAAKAANAIELTAQFLIQLVIGSCDEWIDPIGRSRRTQPSELTFCKLPGRGASACDRLSEIKAAVEVRPELTVADRPHCGMLCRQIRARAQMPHLGEKSARHHLAQPLGNSPVQKRSIGRHQRPAQPPPREARGCRPLKLRQQLAGDRMDLESTLNALRIVWMDARCGLRVDPFELGMN